MGFTRTTSICALMVLICIASANAGPTYTYRFVNLGPLNSAWSDFGGMNSKGQITGNWVGSTSQYQYEQPFIWDNGVTTELGNPYAQDIFVYGIDDSGQVVGDTNAVNGHKFVYKNGAFTDLSSGLGLLGIAPSGVACGTVDISYKTSPHVVVYKDGNVTDLDSTSWGHPTGVNASGHVVGWVPNGTEGPGLPILQPTIWKDGTKQEFNVSFGGLSAYPTAINDADQIVGYGYIEQRDIHGYGLTRAFLFDDGIVTDLGAEAAYDINNNGQMVGTYGLEAAIRDGGSWTRLRTITTGVPSGWQLQSALAINDSGWIAGYALDTTAPGPYPYAQQRLFLVAPIPEPTAAALFGALSLLLATRRATRSARGEPELTQVGALTERG